MPALRDLRLVSMYSSGHEWPLSVHHLKDSIPYDFLLSTVTHSRIIHTPLIVTFRYFSFVYGHPFHEQPHPLRLLFQIMVLKNSLQIVFLRTSYFPTCAGHYGRCTFS